VYLAARALIVEHLAPLTVNGADTSASGRRRRAAPQTCGGVSLVLVLSNTAGHHQSLTGFTASCKVTTGPPHHTQQPIKELRLWTG